jgi:hypothetical protein
LRLGSCDVFARHIDENREALAALLTDSAINREELLAAIVPPCLSIQEMRSDREFSGSLIDLVKLWTAGVDVIEIARAMEIDATRDMAKVLEEVCGYRLPWGIAGYVRIATAQMGLDEQDLSRTVRFLPSIVKWGVPFAEAAWAMSSGIPIRRAAMDIGTRYIADVGGTYREFRQWLSGIDSFILEGVYGLTGLVLEDVARALVQASPSTLLRSGRDVLEMFPLDSELIGVTTAARGALRRARSGARIELVRDYGNFADRNAVIAQLERMDVGYLPRYVAQAIAPEMDCGLRVFGTVEDSAVAVPGPFRIKLHKETARPRPGR